MMWVNFWSEDQSYIIRIICLHEMWGCQHDKSMFMFVFIDSNHCRTKFHLKEIDGKLTHVVLNLFIQNKKKLQFSYCSNLCTFRWNCFVPATFSWCDILGVYPGYIVGISSGICIIWPFVYIMLLIKLFQETLANKPYSIVSYQNFVAWLGKSPWYQHIFMSSGGSFIIYIGHWCVIITSAVEMSW